jgi:hypothetical protein
MRALGWRLRAPVGPTSRFDSALRPINSVDTSGTVAATGWLSGHLVTPDRDRVRIAPSKLQKPWLIRLLKNGSVGARSL